MYKQGFDWQRFFEKERYIFGTLGQTKEKNCGIFSSKNATKHFLEQKTNFFDKINLMKKNA